MSAPERIYVLVDGEHVTICHPFPKGGVFAGGDSRMIEYVPVPQWLPASESQEPDRDVVCTCPDGNWKCWVGYWDPRLKMWRDARGEQRFPTHCQTLHAPLGLKP